MVELPPVPVNGVQLESLGYWKLNRRNGLILLGVIANFEIPFASFKFLPKLFDLSVCLGLRNFILRFQPTYKADPRCEFLEIRIEEHFFGK
ncbi:hypothetical protein HOV93_00350 [Planctomycetes bacterium FF15]|uniref:Uncharacterized protein n=1 Tax=Bremerella alba TaxID=980252 RepID=A0A7V8V115_9BACT|nr:hypothetical protein [Bremerella alba]